MTSRWRCPVGLGWALLLAGCGPAQAPPDLPSAALASTPEGAACSAGDAKSCVSLGFRFEEGRGVGKDEARAAALYRKGCDEDVTEPLAWWAARVARTIEARSRGSLRRLEEMRAPPRRRFPGREHDPWQLLTRAY